MRAVQIREFGGPDVLELVDDAPRPGAGDGEVLIRVSRAGINFADTHSRENAYVAKYELPFTPGAEVAGTREDTGERVVALIDTGGYAEYAVAPAARTFPVPEGLDDGTALALLIQGLNAWHLYRTAAKVQPGESVVVHGAAGGVGSLAVQLGKPMGAGRVIASASSEEKRALALELGADAAVDSAPDGLKERLIEANGGKPGGRGVRDRRRPGLRREHRGARAVRADRRQRDRDQGAERDADGPPAAEELVRRRLLADALPRQARPDRGAAGGPVRARGAR